MPKLILVFCFIILCENVKTQNDTVNKKVTNVFISAGLHAGFFSLTGIAAPPAQIQVDVNVINNFFMGAGYSYDKYSASNFFLLYRPNESTRHNIRMRIYSYFGNYKKPIMAYSGCSMGLSIWNYNNSNLYSINYSILTTKNYLLPSFQIFFGLKSTIYKNIFNISEISFGSPYFMQTSFGYKF
ncbi:MAG: hypothetical protein LCH32_04100 [Bacteroidetes bacterium]|nr:hypothetical protein [Bacteroidota bacterium]